MAYRLQISSSEHQENVSSFLESCRELDPDLTLLPEEGLPVTTHSLALSLYSPSLRNTLCSLPPSTLLSLSVPASSSSLSQLLQLLTTGKVVSQTRQELEQVQEVAKVLGISLGDCQVGARRQGVIQEKEGKKEIKQEEPQEAEIQEKYSIKVEMEDEPRKATENEPGTALSCSLCYEIIESTEKLDEHMLREHGTASVLTKSQKPPTTKIRFSCNECNKTFSHKFKLAIHTKDNHQALTERETLYLAASNFDHNALDLEKSYSCINCSKKFTTIKQRYNHTSTVHSGVMLSCDECDKQFSRKDKLNTHKQIIHLGVTIQCEECDKQFSRKDKLSTHRKNKHFI